MQAEHLRVTGHKEHQLLQPPLSPVTYFHRHPVPAGTFIPLTALSHPHNTGIPCTASIRNYILRKSILYTDTLFSLEELNNMFQLHKIAGGSGQQVLLRPSSILLQAFSRNAQAGT